MAFCNSCGTSLANDSQFCPKCGAAQAGGATPAPIAQAGARPHGSSLRLWLAIAAGLAALGVIVIAMLTLVGLHIARHTRVTENGDNVRVEGPFGTINTNTGDVSRNLGVDVYPGARLVKDSGANVQVGNMQTIAAEFESDDPPEKVADFYKSKFPNANVTVSNPHDYTIVSLDKKNMLTINIEPENGKTRLKIASVSGKGTAGSSSD
jgi:hypothetical protein